jgi:CBS domain-containing protein
MSVGFQPRRLSRVVEPRWPAILAGLAGGATLAFFLDPNAGRRRRALARDKALRAAHAGRRDFSRVEHDVSNRARGLFARLRARLTEAGASDEVVEERVRSALGRVCSHAGAIAVSATEGDVVLRGPVLRYEHARVLREASRVRGVVSIEDQLEPHSRTAHVPGLQESRGRPFEAAPPRCADLMKRRVQTARASDPIDRAAEKMALGNLGFLPVCDDDKRVIGTLTDRDIVVRVVAKGRSPEACTVGDVMSRDVVACEADDDLTLAEQLMARNQVSRLVVTDDDGTLAGVISLSDVAEHEPARRVARTLRAVAAREAPQP